MKFFPERASASPTALARALTAIGTQYRKGAKRGAEAFSRAQARKALDLVLAVPTITYRELLLLNGRAEDAVFNQLLMMKGSWQSGDYVYDKLHAGMLDPALLRAACETARDSIMAAKGADKNGALLHCTAQLCELYEAMAETRITLSNRESRAYTQTPRSRGARFVCEALVLIAGLDDESVNNQLRAKGSGFLRAWIEDRPSRNPVHIPRT